jgi:hypothetical protein
MEICIAFGKAYSRNHGEAKSSNDLRLRHGFAVPLGRMI